MTGPPPNSLQTEDLIRWYKLWNHEGGKWGGCNCNGCLATKGIAEVLTRLHDGEPYNPSMLYGLTTWQRDMILKAIMLRTLGAKT